MKRREFIALLGGTAAAWPLAARAQQSGRMARIGYLGLGSYQQQLPYFSAFREGLRKLGYLEGGNVQIEFRAAEGVIDRLPGLAAELVRLNVDVIVTYATGVDVARRTTATIPIVMATYGDAVATGVVVSLARPGGNVTGLTFFYPELMAKRLELLKEIVPSMNRAGVLLFRDNATNGQALEVMASTAKALRTELIPLEVSTPSEFSGAFSTWITQQTEVLVVADHGFLVANANAVAALAAKHRLPSAGPLELAVSGGLIAYGVNFQDMFRRSAALVDKILKGAKPGDIPVEQAAKFKTIVNLKSARAMGMEVPTSLLLRADEVIE